MSQIQLQYKVIKCDECDYKECEKCKIEAYGECGNANCKKYGKLNMKEFYMPYGQTHYLGLCDKCANELEQYEQQVIESEYVYPIGK